MAPRPDDDLSKLEQLDEDHILQALRRRNILDNNYVSQIYLCIPVIITIRVRFLISSGNQKFPLCTCR